MILSVSFYPYLQLSFPHTFDSGASKIKRNNVLYFLKTLFQHASIWMTTVSFHPYFHTYKYSDKGTLQTYSRAKSKMTNRTTTLNYNNKSHFLWGLGVRSSSLVNSVRSVTGQMQQPEEEVSGVAAFELAALVVSFLLHEAQLVCGAALCGRVWK